MKLWLGLLLLTLTACSSTPPASEEAPSSEAAEASPDLSSTPDPLFAPDPATEEAALATPVENEASPLAEPTPPTAELPAPSQETAAMEPPPAPEAPAALSSELPAPATAEKPIAAATAPTGAGPKKSVQEEFNEYQNRIEAREAEDDALETRALFPHEGGSLQIGLDYTNGAFSDYDFDPTQAIKNADSTKGAMLSFIYFPVHSLSLGRLGIGPQASVYWSDFSVGNSVVREGVAATRSYGGRLVYEFAYFLGQWIVPHAFFGYDYVSVKTVKVTIATNPDPIADFPSRTFYSQSIGGGLRLNLNRLEADTAHRALVSTGIRKVYLNYTVQQRLGNQGNDLAHFLGLRFEM